MTEVLAGNFLTTKNPSAAVKVVLWALLNFDKFLYVFYSFLFWTTSSYKVPG